VEITYAETTRAPASLGAGVEYASQLKAFGTPMARVQGDGEATILGLVDAPDDADDDEFEVRPAGEFDFNLHSRAGKSAPRDLDAEVANLDLDSSFSFGSANTQAPARAAKPQPEPAAAPARSAPARPAHKSASEVWELDEPTAKPAAAALSVTLEIDGLSGDLRRAVEALFGKVVELPSLRVRIKGRDLE